MVFIVEVVTGRRDTRLDSASSLSEDLCARCLFNIYPQKVPVRDVKARSLRKLFRKDLWARSLFSSPGLCTRSLQEVSWQDPCAWSLKQVSWQNLCKRPLGKIPAQISIRGLLARSLHKLPIGGLLARSLCEISVEAPSIRALLARSM